jgi:IS4 transposase
VDKQTGLIYDQSVLLTGFYAAKDYPNQLRRIKYYDAKTDKTLVFLTNNFSLPALTIAELYRYRWQVELFFKWIKQHLRIKSFFGTSENAVKSQIWIAISVYVLMAIIKKRLDLSTDLYTISQILSLTLFEKSSLDQTLANHDYKTDRNDMSNQLNLFDNLTGH